MKGIILLIIVIILIIIASKINYINDSQHNIPPAGLEVLHENEYISRPDVPEEFAPVTIFEDFQDPAERILLSKQPRIKFAETRQERIYDKESGIIIGEGIGAL